MPAEFQLNLELERNKNRSKLVFNKDYFNNKYMLERSPPEQKLKELIANGIGTS